MQHEPRLQLLTEQQSDCEAFFSEPPWGPGFSNSEEMNHKKQWWAVKTSVCKAQGGMNTTGICGWMRRGENLLQCRQLCGNPSMVTVFGHSLWDQAKDLGQGKMSTWQRRKDWQKRLGCVNYLYCSGWAPTENIWGLTKHMPEFSTLGTSSLDKKFMSWMSLRAGHRHASLVKEEFQPLFPCFPYHLAARGALKGCQGQIKGWFRQATVSLCTQVPLR